MLKRLFGKKDYSIKGYEIIYKDWKYPYQESMTVEDGELKATITKLIQQGFEVLRYEIIR